MKDSISGSSASGEPEFLAVGKLRRPHGVHGEILMSVWTDFPDRLREGVQLFLGDTFQPARIKTLRWHRQDLLITFEDYSDREQAGELRNQVVFVRTDQIPPLDDGELYLHEILGLHVVRQDTGDQLGEIVEIIETGANDVYVVRSPEGIEHLIPAIDSVILEIDLERREIRIQSLPGLFSD